MITELLLGGVGGPVAVAAVIGTVRWGFTSARLLGKVTELVDDVRTLTGAMTEATQDAVRLRAEFTAHVQTAEDRWAMLLGRHPVPRPRGHTGEDRRRSRPVLDEAGA